jgi:integrase
VTITSETIGAFTAYLRREEKSKATIEKYSRYARAFAEFVGAEELTKDSSVLFKEQLETHFTASGGNGAISSVNCLLGFLGLREFGLKIFTIQKKTFAEPEREIVRIEFEKLIAAAEQLGRTRIGMVIQTLAATGIRVSELRFVTVEAVKRGETEISLKGKTRKIFLPKQLCRKLKEYIKTKKLESGMVFITRGGKPLDRSYIWSEMKKLGAAAKVAPRKIFPHNLRHLFARTYYAKSKDLVELAAILGHSDVNTTRIYTMNSGATYRKRLDSLGLVG